MRARIGLVAVALVGASGGEASAAAGDGILLAPHRAVYDMSLGQSRAGSNVTAVRGRMVYELTGSACEGFTQNMRFVTEMTNQDGQAMLTDLRSSTWEDGQARIFRFNTTTLRDHKATDVVVGDANRAGPAGPVKVDVTKPAKKALSLNAGTYYPVQHSIALLKAAKSGETKLRADLYDGSEKGEKAYDTNARIGKLTPAGADRKLPDLAAAKTLAGLPSWPVTIGYYEQGSEKQDATPVYELSFVYFENGVSHRLVIDYGDFAIKGELADLTFTEVAKCDGK